MGIFARREILVMHVHYLLMVIVQQVMAIPRMARLIAAVKVVEVYSAIMVTT
jgi:hypothetical protein